MNILSYFLSQVINFCYYLLENYLFSIVAFTILTKIILFPVSMWVQRNSIKMVQLTPELNHLKVKFYGDKDTRKLIITPWQARFPCLYSLFC